MIIDDDIGYGEVFIFSSLTFASSNVAIQVSCVQVWYYNTMYPKDAWYLKLLVGITSLCSSLGIKCSS